MSSRSFALFVMVTLAPRLAYAAEPAAPAPGGYGLLLLKMALILGGVCLLAWVSLRWGLKRFVAPDRNGTGAMEVLGRLPLEPRRTLLVVRIASRHLVLSSSESGVERIAELSPEEAAAFVAEPRPRKTFQDVFAALSPSTVSRETSAAEES